MSGIVGLSARTVINSIRTVDRAMTLINNPQNHPNFQTLVNAGAIRIGPDGIVEIMSSRFVHPDLLRLEREGVIRFGPNNSITQSNLTLGMVRDVERVLAPIEMIRLAETSGNPSNTLDRIIADRYNSNSIRR